MFEDSLVTSGPKARRGALRKHWIVASSFGAQASLLASFAIFPLLWPATLPKNLLALKLTSLSLSTKPEIKLQPKPQAIRAATSNAVSAPTSTRYVEARQGGTIAGPRINEFHEIDEGPPSIAGTGMGAHGSLFGGDDLKLGAGSGPAVTVIPARLGRPSKLPVSSGVMAGRLLSAIRPVYPRIAIATRTEGTVIVTATIDTQGRIVGLQVLSGPQMLRTAAVDAVKEARYKPFLLNGEPTEVVTTITVNFRMGG